MTIFDSNVWVALFHEHDSLHDRAVSVLSTIVAPLIVPEYVIVETCTVLERTAGKIAADTFIDYLENTENVEILYSNFSVLNETLRFYQAHPHRGLSFVDVALLHFSSTHLVITFDAALKRAVTRMK
jgi:predicted nucleic acid-binding protein